MRASARVSPREDADDAAEHVDQRVILHGVRWSDFEAFLRMRGDDAGIRIAYLEGELELMTPSIDHEGIKTTIARIVEAYAEERGIAFNGYGSWTLKRPRKRRAIEPDECYVLGTHRPKAPDLAIAVVWTSGGLDKLDIYRGLGVREVWIWQRGSITVHAMRGETYVAQAKSTLLPHLDLNLVASFVPAEDQTDAVRRFRHALTKKRRR